VLNLVFSPNGRYLASATKEGRVKIWDGTHLDKPQTNALEIGPAGGDLADAVAFSPDSIHLAIKGSDYGATIWDLNNPVIPVPLDSPTQGFRALAFSPNGRWIASGGVDCRVKLWDARTGKLLRNLPGHQSDVTRLAFFPQTDNPRLISASKDR